MSKNSRKLDSRSIEQHAKRHCTLPAQATENNTPKVLSESILWPESNESFFSNALDDLIDHTERKPDDVPKQSTNFYESDSDDNLFCDIQVPVVNKNNDVNKIKQTEEIEQDDTIFMKINLNNINGRETEDLFGSDHEDSENLLAENIQNTQRFLDDVATFKMPRVPETTAAKPLELTVVNHEDSLLSHSVMEGIVQGSQYETYEAIQQRIVENTIMQQPHAAHIAVPTPPPPLDVTNLSRYNWDLQDFTQEHEFPSQGNFYGLPDRVGQLIFEHKGIKSLYEWQDECLNLPAIKKRKNLIYALPTSGGKTLVSEILMLRELICRRKNVIFILPYVSIVQEKVSAMSPFAITLDFLVEEYTAGKGKCPPVERRKRKSLFVASIEKGAVLLDSLIDVGRTKEIGLVVIDELHLIGERGRGATLESFLTKIMYMNDGIQIVGMSATIGNLSEISTFLNADVYTRGFRPVELKEYIKCGRDILEINLAGNELEEIFVFKRSINYNYSEAVLRADPDHLAGLVVECAPKHCCLIFCSTRKNCESVALLLSRILPKNKFVEHRKNEKRDLMDALDKVCGILSPVLAKTLPYGVAYHHSGLTTDERKFIETAYRLGVITVICCTSTLAAGVNLPAKRVIIRAPYVGSEFMTLCKYKQMIGRAGRAGLGEAGESILIAQSRDNLRISEMLFSPMDKALSSMDEQNAVGLQALILSSIGLGLAASRRDLYQLVNRTLLAVQAKILNVSIEDLVMQIVRAMFRNKVLQIDSNEEQRTNTTEIITTQDVNSSSSSSKDRRVFIGKSTRFRLTTIGQAAFKAGIDYKRAHAIHKELQLAQKQLVLTNYSHLLYLVVAFNSNEKGDELFAANTTIFFNAYTSLDEHTLTLCRILGLNEAQAAKIVKSNKIQESIELKLNRIYKVLVLMDILNLMPLPAVAQKYNVERGTLQSLINQAIAASSGIVRLCDQDENLWCYKSLFERILGKMDRCGTMELEPLLELPAVRINRAKQLYTAGFRTIEDIAKARPMDLVKQIEHMPLKISKEIISAAKILLMKKLDHLEEETEALKSCLHFNKNID